MHYLRIYADAAGDTHFEDVTVAASPMTPPLPGHVSEAMPATSIVFRQVAADTYIDWHPAPRRQFVVTLSGAVEFTASDGEQRQVGPGSIVLAEDVHGKGHSTRVLPGEEWRNVWVPLVP